MRLSLFLLLSVLALGVAFAGTAQRGYDLLVEKPYLRPDLDEETFRELWRAWPDELREVARSATESERRQMAFSRYGLTRRPGGDTDGPPLQYVVDERGDWTMSCFTCHSGQVDGRVIPGLPNSNLDLQTFMEEVRETNRRLEKPQGRLPAAVPFLPLGGSRGTTNAVVFGILLQHGRDKDLKPELRFPPLRLPHHDMDAPPLWSYRKKSRLYIDGFAGKQHRALMQFILIPENKPEQLKEWEEDFREIDAWLEMLEPPDWPHEVDSALAERGRAVFERNCASCHGTYGEDATYPERTLPLQVVGTDPVRLSALSPEHRREYGESWLGQYGESEVVESPKGYVAPPLDGIWATAPYLHNGSVPTLWHLLRPDERPVVWRRSETGYDRDRVGLEVREMSEMPPDAQSGARRREYFDTRVRGKSAAGHRFPERLSESEKQAVLEYLKTL